jgi:CBS domain-containing protein
MVTVGDVLRRGRPVLAPDDTLLEAAHWLKHEGVAALPVCDGDRIIGTLSDRDIVLRAVATGLDTATTQVRSAMQTEISWCFEHDTLEHAVQVMRDRQARRLVVVDEKKKLLGMLSLEEMRAAQLSGQPPAVPGP